MTTALVTETRRRWLMGAVGLAAACAGGGLAWWRSKEGAGRDAGAEALWAMDFDTPSGGMLKLASLRGRPLVVNFWATWCPPCVEEMPLLDSFFKDNAKNGWQVVGLAIDQPSSVRKFLAKTPVTYSIGLAGLGGTELGKALGNTGGGLPFTVLVSPNGQIVRRKMGRLAPEDIAGWRSVA